MKRPILFIFIIGVLFSAGCLHRKPLPFQCGYIFTKEEAVRKYFGPEIKAINYQPGDSIAFIGASNGYRAAMLSMLVDSIHFYLQDIDTLCLNTQEVNNAWSYYENLHGAPFYSTYETVLGSEHATGLPEGRMEKVVITATFHHFSDTLGMLNDLRNILKPEGRLYIIENIVEESGDRRKKLCQHTLYTEEELRKLFEANGFEVISVKSLHQEFTKVFELKAVKIPALDLQNHQRLEKKAVTR